MKFVRLEIWKSSENEEEIHFFEQGTNRYVFGFNPAYITLTKAATILGALGYEPPEGFYKL